MNFARLTLLEISEVGTIYSNEIWRKPTWCTSVALGFNIIKGRWGSGLGKGKLYVHIILDSVCGTYFRTAALKFLTAVEGNQGCNNVCPCGLFRTYKAYPVLIWVLRGHNQGWTCGPIVCICKEYLLWDPGAWFVDLVVGNRVCNNASWTWPARCISVAWGFKV